MKRFGPFTLDAKIECIWYGARRLDLSPKAYSVLCYLVTNADRLVKKEELLEAIWPDVFVQEAVLKVHVLEIRKALGDNAARPTYIATEHRRGYRFVASVTDATLSETALAPSTFLGR